MTAEVVKVSLWGPDPPPYIPHFGHADNGVNAARLHSFNPQLIIAFLDTKYLVRSPHIIIYAVYEKYNFLLLISLYIYIYILPICLHISAFQLDMAHIFSMHVNLYKYINV